MESKVPHKAQRSIGSLSLKKIPTVSSKSQTPPVVARRQLVHSLGRPQTESEQCSVDLEAKDNEVCMLPPPVPTRTYNRDKSVSLPQDKQASTPDPKSRHSSDSDSDSYVSVTPPNQLDQCLSSSDAESEGYTQMHPASSRDNNSDFSDSEKFESDSLRPAPVELVKTFNLERQKKSPQEFEDPSVKAFGTDPTNLCSTQDNCSIRGELKYDYVRFRVLPSAPSKNSGHGKSTQMPGEQQAKVNKEANSPLQKSTIEDCTQRSKVSVNTYEQGSDFESDSSCDSEGYTLPDRPFLSTRMKPKRKVCEGRRTQECESDSDGYVPLLQVAASPVKLQNISQSFETECLNLSQHGRSNSDDFTSHPETVGQEEVDTQYEPVSPQEDESNTHYEPVTNSDTYINIPQTGSSPVEQSRKQVCQYEPVSLSPNNNSKRSGSDYLTILSSPEEPKQSSVVKHYRAKPAGTRGKDTHIQKPEVPKRLGSSYKSIVHNSESCSSDGRDSATTPDSPPPPPVPIRRTLRKSERKPPSFDDSEPCHTTGHRLHSGKYDDDANSSSITQKPPLVKAHIQETASLSRSETVHKGFNALSSPVEPHTKPQISKAQTLPPLQSARVAVPRRLSGESVGHDSRKFLIQLDTKRAPRKRDTHETVVLNTK